MRGGITVSRSMPELRCRGGGGVDGFKCADYGVGGAIVRSVDFSACLALPFTQNLFGGPPASNMQREWRGAIALPRCIKACGLAARYWSSTCERMRMTCQSEGVVFCDDPRMHVRKLRPGTTLQGATDEQSAHMKIVGALARFSSLPVIFEGGTGAGRTCYAYISPESWCGPCGHLSHSRIAPSHSTHLYRAYASGTPPHVDHYYIRKSS
ncbi:hypothetical protein BDZ91DRAFT_447750 [Kalaharituber pfeilii]|nr:hypothetical protein BDZ91DRAFT_447750 [Kalaharituber pfeilii]